MNMFTYPLGLLLFFVGFILAAIALAVRAKNRPFTSEAAFFSLAFIVLIVELSWYNLLMFLTHHVADGGLLSDEKWLLFDLILFFVLGVVVVFIVGLITENFVPAVRKYLSAKQVNNISIAILLLFAGIHWYKNRIPNVNISKATYMKIEGFKPSHYYVQAILNFQSKDRSCSFRSETDYILVAKEEASNYTLQLPRSAKQGDCDFELSSFTIMLHLKNSLYFFREHDFDAFVSHWFTTVKVKEEPNIFVQDFSLVESISYNSDDFSEVDVYCQRFLLSRDHTRSDAICRSVQQGDIRMLYFSQHFIETQPMIVNILLSEDFKREASGRYEEADNEETVEQNKTKRAVPVIQFELEQNTSTLELSIYDRTERMITGSDTESTTHIIHTNFMPSIELFAPYENSQKKKIK